MREKIFVDSNVLVYSRDTALPGKQSTAIDWLKLLWESRSGRISLQVLHEFYVTVTMKLKPGMAKKDAREEIRDLLAWQPPAMTPAVLMRTWDVQDRYSLSFWDAMIVASAVIQECKYLLSEDLNHGQQYFGVTVINPFRVSPADFVESLNS